MPEHLRPAIAADVDAMARLAGERRAEYAEYQPQFCRQAPDAERRHRPFLATLAASDDVVALVSKDGGRTSMNRSAPCCGKPDFGSRPNGG